MQGNQSRQAYLSMHNLEKVYPNGEKAVYSFNLDVEKNEFIVIVGPSGCGKSTILRMIAGLEDLSGGDIYLDGELLNYKACKDRKMAIVFQSYALYPQMNVFENIAFPLTINQYPFPVVNTVLRTDAELRRVLESVPFNKISDVLYNVFHSKSKFSEKEEQVAALFSISLDAAKLLCKIYGTFKQESLDGLQGKGAEFINAVYSELEHIVATENKRVAAEGIKLDDEFCKLDENDEREIIFRRMTSYEIKAKVYKTAEVLDLTPYLDKLPKELSGGQMQRVALGRAIVKNVPVFMMDEPLSNLDAKLRLTMRSEIVKLHNKIGATTIYVTHDQTEAMTMASRIVVMSRGFVQQIGTPSEIYNSPVNLFVAKFIGSPTMNFFEMNYDIDNGYLYNDNLKIAVKEKFVSRYREFYEKKHDMFYTLLQDFDKTAAESVLKILSAMDTKKDIKMQKGNKTSFSDRIKRLFKKESIPEPNSEERRIAEELLSKIAVYQKGGQPLVIGIRPEHIKIEKRRAGVEYDNAVILRPTVCELLGAEYNIHFDYCGKSMVCKIDAKQSITTADDIVVRFSFDDIYIFDPVTGDVI